MLSADDGVAAHPGDLARLFQEFLDLPRKLGHSRIMDARQGTFLITAPRRRGTRDQVDDTELMRLMVVSAVLFAVSGFGLTGCSNTSVSSSQGATDTGATAAERTLHGHLDQAALRLSRRYIEAEYVNRNCAEVNPLLHNLAPSAFECQSEVRSARKYNEHLVEGPGKVKRNCRGGIFILLNADECVTYTIVGKTPLLSTSNGHPTVSFAVKIISVYLNRGQNSHWEVAGQGVVVTGEVPAYDPRARVLWSHRLPVKAT
jgi:hypothetical protein